MPSNSRRAYRFRSIRPVPQVDRNRWSRYLNQWALLRKHAPCETDKEFEESTRVKCLASTAERILPRKSFRVRRTWQGIQSEATIVASRPFIHGNETTVQVLKEAGCNA